MSMPGYAKHKDETLRILLSHHRIILEFREVSLTNDLIWHLSQTTVLAAHFNDTAVTPVDEWK